MLVARAGGQISYAIAGSRREIAVGLRGHPDDAGIGRLTSLSYCLPKQRQVQFGVPFSGWRAFMIE